jgi:hypothetical protein
LCRWSLLNLDASADAKTSTLHHECSNWKDGHRDGQFRVE